MAKNTPQEIFRLYYIIIVNFKNNSLLSRLLITGALSGNSKPRSRSYHCIASGDEQAVPE